MLHNLREILEGAEAANITGRYSPNNNLLKPEYEPRQSTARTPKTEPMDELIDFDELADNITPGKGVAYPQKDNKQENMNVVKQLTKRRGRLFDRDAAGNVVIPGIHKDNEKSINKEHSNTLRDMLTK